MTAWNATPTGVSRDEAKTKIVEIAKTKGIRGAFKVYYEGHLMVSGDDLPDTVDMSKVEVSAVADQA